MQSSRRRNKHAHTETNGSTSVCTETFSFNVLGKNARLTVVLEKLPQYAGAVTKWKTDWCDSNALDLCLKHVCNSFKFLRFAEGCLNYCVFLISLCSLMLKTTLKRASTVQETSSRVHSKMHNSYSSVNRLFKIPEIE